VDVFPYAGKATGVVWLREKPALREAEGLRAGKCGEVTPTYASETTKIAEHMRDFGCHTLSRAVYDVDQHSTKDQRRSK